MEQLQRVNGHPSKEDLSFGVGLRGTRQLAMRSLIRNLDGQRFEGCEDGSPVVPLFATADDARDYFSKALLDRIQAAGVQLSQCPAGSNPVMVLEIDGAESSVMGAPFEPILIMGMMPSQITEGKGTSVERLSAILEACMEFQRVLVESAIADAMEDADPGEPVMVVVRALESANRTSLESAKLGVSVRLRAVVVCATEPRVSYLMGTAVDEPKPHGIGWEIPLVEFFWGPDRLRWMDKRSPKFIREQPKGMPS